MRNRLLIAIVGLATVTTLAACGDASPSSGIQRSRGAGIPNDPTEQEGAVPDKDDPANPNASTPPPKPATPGTPAASGQLGVTLSNATPAADLGTSTEITVTIEPKAGLTGTATLTATGVPAGATATFSPATVTLNTTAATAKLTIAVPYTAAPSAAGAASALVVKAAVGTVEATANANFKVNPKLTMTVPVNATALLAAGGGAKSVDGWGSPVFGTAQAPLQTQAGNGISVTVKNLDSAAHIVHGNTGFPHGDIAIPPGGVDTKVRTLQPGVTTSGYIHGEANGTSVGFGIKVNTAQ